MVLLLLGVYFGFAHYYSGHFYPKSELNGLEVGNQTAEEAKKVLESQTKDYLLTIYDRDGNKYHIKGYDIDYQYVSTGEEETILDEQNGFAWPVQVRKATNTEMDLSITYDADKLSAAVSSLECLQEENITYPEDAYIDETDSGFQIVEEVKGNELIAENVQAKVKEAVDLGESELTLEDEDYAAPAVTSEDEQLNGCISNINNYISSTVTYDIPGYEEKVTSEDIASWLNVAEDYTVTVDEDAIASYVQSLATKYNTYADVRDFKTSKGDTVQIGGGDYGWVVDKVAEAEQLKQDIASGQAVEREPVYQQTAVQREGLDDIGNTYVEIDYTNQHLWYYKDGELKLDTDVVTGNINKGNGSPDGLFKISTLKSPAVLVGEDYASDVQYFMVFAYNVGIHDASWRHGQFGGETYKTTGSHGCINVSEEAAANLFGMLEMGTPVIAYYREPVELNAENCRIANAYSYVDPEKEEDTAQ